MIPPKYPRLLSLTLTAALTAFAGEAHAAVIASRVALNSMIGGNGTTEDFESWTGTSITPAGFTTLNSTTVVGGQGPGIVEPGVTFSNFNSNRALDELQLDRRAQYNIPSGALLAEGGTLVMDFTVTVRAIGFDFFQFLAWADTAVVQVFGTNDSTLLFTSGPLAAPDAPSATFFGYENKDGIGKVLITSSIQEWSPLVDNLTFSAVPEPTGLALAGLSGLALLTRRRR